MIVSALQIHPRLPALDGIFNLGNNVLISAHSPHEHIAEHLHDHLNHMHIRYGFEIPAQDFAGIETTALQVAMRINTLHRVDCNPVFVARGPGAEGVCWKIAGEDVHWVHDEAVGEKATQAWTSTGRSLDPNYRFSGFATSDLQERRVRHYTRTELAAAIGLGVRCDQHFQATWIEPSEAPIEPYDVAIFLSDSESGFSTFFSLPTTVALGPS